MDGIIRTKTVQSVQVPVCGLSLLICSMKGPQILLSSELDIENRTSSRCKQETISFSHFLKQGGEAVFHSVRITRFAMTMPNIRACCRGEGRAVRAAQNHQEALRNQLSVINSTVKVKNVDPKTCEFRAGPEKVTKGTIS